VHFDRKHYELQQQNHSLLGKRTSMNLSNSGINDPCQTAKLSGATASATTNSKVNGNVASAIGN